MLFRDTLWYLQNKTESNSHLWIRLDKPHLQHKHIVFFKIKLIRYKFFNLISSFFFQKWTKIDIMLIMTHLCEFTNIMSINAWNKKQNKQVKTMTKTNLCISVLYLSYNPTYLFICHIKQAHQITPLSSSSNMYLCLW